MQALQIQGFVWDNLVDSSSDSLSSLTQLSKLELDLWPADPAVDFEIAGLDAMLTKLLENAVHLKTLHLESGHDGGEHKYLRQIFTTISRMRIEKLMLSFVYLDLFNPFKNRMESLRQLELFDCNAYSSLKNILLSIQTSCPQLEYLRLSSMPRDWIDEDIELRGTQGINEGMDKLMQSRRDYYNNTDHMFWDSDED